MVLARGKRCFKYEKRSCRNRRPGQRPGWVPDILPRSAAVGRPGAGQRVHRELQYFRLRDADPRKDRRAVFGTRRSGDDVEDRGPRPRRAAGTHAFRGIRAEDARFGIPRPNGEAYVYFKFDTSSIPDGAEIVSVSCTAKAAANGNATTTPVKQIQMATGTTLKGTATTISSSTTERTLDVGEWTLAELRDARIRPYAKTGNTSSNYYLDFYGATLTIKYKI